MKPTGILLMKMAMNATLPRHFVENYIWMKMYPGDMGFHAHTLLFAEQQTKLCTYLLSVKCCAITCLFTKIATNYQ